MTARLIRGVHALCPVSLGALQAVLLLTGMAQALIRHLRRPLLWLSGWLLQALCLMLALCLTWLPLYGAGAPLIGGDASALAAFCRAQIDLLSGEDGCLPDGGDVNVWCREAAAAAQAYFGKPLTAPAVIRGSALLDRLGVAGFFWPLSGESLVNADDLPLLIPFTVCHELAHQAGVAGEGAANAEAYALCNAMGGVYLRSARVAMLLCGMRELRGLDEAAWDACVNAMSATLRQYFARAGGLVPANAPRTASDRLFDAMLRLCGEPSGLASYQSAVWACLEITA